MNLRRRALLFGALVPVLGTGARAKAETRYFPHGSLSAIPELSVRQEKWFGDQLRALKEESLLDPPANRVLYRFTWLRSFHPPMAFTLVFREEGTSVLKVKMASGKGGYDPGTLILDKEVEVPSYLTKELRLGLDSLKFWELPSEMQGELGFDGAEWILEGNENGKYHVVVRWIGKDIGVWCRTLILLSGVDVGEIY